MNLSQTQEHCYQLRLYGMHESMERRIQEALNHELHPAEFLNLLLQDEIVNRKERQAKRLMTRARFRRHADLEDWDMTYDRGFSKAMFKELALLSFYHRGQNLLLFGPTGSGKTHLAISLGRRLCQENIPTRFLSMNLLCEEIQAHKTAGTYLVFLRSLHRANVLILDDFGLRNYTHDEAMSLTEILEERYRQGTLILSSQVQPQGWKNLFEDPVAAEAVIDRILHPSYSITLKGASYRQHLHSTLNSQMSLKTTPPKKKKVEGKMKI